jgi:hypothetical protein
MPVSQAGYFWRFCRGMEFPLCTMSAEVSAFRTVLAAEILSLPVSIFRSLTRVATDLSCNNDLIYIINVVIIIISSSGGSSSSCYC